jgi:hypothetical protein
VSQDPSPTRGGGVGGKAGLPSRPLSFQGTLETGPDPAASCSRAMDIVYILCPPTPQEPAPRFPPDPPLARNRWMRARATEGTDTAGLVSPDEVDIRGRRGSPGLIHSQPSGRRGAPLCSRGRVRGPPGSGRAQAEGSGLLGPRLTRRNKEPPGRWARTAAVLLLRGGAEESGGGQHELYRNVGERSRRARRHGDAQQGSWPHCRGLCMM